jgi:probable rRNA maturation factor
MFTNFEIMETTSGVKINFFYQSCAFTLKNRNRLKEMISKLLKTEKALFSEISIIFCSDKHLLEINKKYLNHDYYTDIITFELPGEIGKGPVGEIYISVERVKENSMRERVSFKKEIHRVIFHGLLHLCGYGDKNVREIKQMRGKEDYYLEQYGV